MQLYTSKTILTVIYMLFKNNCKFEFNSQCLNVTSSKCEHVNFYKMKILNEF